MELAASLAHYAHALGRYQAAWRFASPELRRAVALAQISGAWDAFRRDAGPGNVGPAHETSVTSAALLTSDDPRRDGVVLWLADHGPPAVAEAAGLLARASRASRRLDRNDQVLLEAACDAFADSPPGNGPIVRALGAALDGDGPVFDDLIVLATAVDQLRADPAFLEGSGDAIRHVLPAGTIDHFVPSSPGATWALNLALFARRPPFSGVLHCPGLISRQLFRALEPEEIAMALVEGAAASLEASYVLCERIEPQLARGREALSHMSRNSRTREVWSLVVALGAISRAQLARALGLSRAGADIQASGLADAGLVYLRPGGRIEWVRSRQTETVPNALAEEREPASAFADFDESMAEVDRLLAREIR